jgi:hypothetical protein
LSPRLSGDCSCTSNPFLDDSRTLSKARSAAAPHMWPGQHQRVIRRARIFFIYERNHVRSKIGPMGARSHETAISHRGQHLTGFQFGAQPQIPRALRRRIHRVVGATCPMPSAYPIAKAYFHDLGRRPSAPSDKGQADEVIAISAEPGMAYFAAKFRDSRPG